METYGEALLHLKRGFLIIGLTGYTGSGCSTARRLLRYSKKPPFPAYMPPQQDFEYNKLKAFWSDLKWHKFVDIEVSRVIFAIAVSQALRYSYKREPFATLRQLALPKRKSLVALKLLVDKDVDIKKGNSAEKLVSAYKAVKPLYGQFKKKRKYALHSFIEELEGLGDNIRKFGKPVQSRDDEPKPANIYVLPEAIRRLIKAYRIAEEASHFVIDAFRNPFEVEYFKRRYSEFYLVSISRPSDERYKALKNAKLPQKFIEDLEKREKGKAVTKKLRDNIHEWVTSLDVDSCSQKADYFIQNHNNGATPRSHLLYHLIRLISLTKKPGCVPPTKDERSMQLAMSARQNSGCLSRHVGAVMTNSEGYVLGVGWNDPPYGQVPCSLRTANQLITDKDKKTFSQYERSEKFIEHIKSRNLKDNPFCFKEELAALEQKEKMAEFTRAVHAEENALLQATRHGTEIVREGTLYTTDFPCTLCAKKAYQLGVHRIVYIEDYPGISKEQTLNAGKTPIKTEQFEGATGAAYFDLFTTLLPEKDFIKLYM